MAQSAKGLFRATGNIPSERERDPHDFMPTPPEATQAFLAAERDRLRDFPVIWEPAAGDGRMVREFQRAGFEVIVSDLIDRGCGADICDFFDSVVAASPCLVTNPPYQEVNARDGKGRWVHHAIGKLGVEYMALLLNWSWPCAAGLAEVWERFPPARIYCCRWKIDFTGEGAPPMTNGWFVWDQAHRGEPVFRVMDRRDPLQVDLEDMLKEAAE